MKAAYKFVLPLILLVLFSVLTAQAQFTSGPSQYSFIQNSVGLSSTNTISDGPGPMQITFDVLSNGSLAQMFTSSTCSNSGQPNSATHTVGHTGIDVYTFVMDTGTITLTENSATSSLYTASGPSACVGSSNKTYTLNVWAGLEQGGYFGFGFFFGNNYQVSYKKQVYNGSTGTLASSNLGITTNNDGMLIASGYLTSFSGTRNACFVGQTFTSNTALAQSFDANFVSGDVGEITVDDGNGNVVTFIISATDANGNTSDINWPSEAYFTYIVDAGNCAGQQGTDAPGHVVSGELAAPQVAHSPIFTHGFVATARPVRNMVTKREVR